MRSELDKVDLQLVAVSSDSPKQIQEGKHKHNANAVLLSDTDMTVTRQLGIENTARMVKPPGLIGLPIPTTVLCDADGIVRWIDQSDDYVMRSEPERVLRAIHDSLKPKAGLA